jgi:peptidoglycan L-alanyl-D-glutamate endopeptidase CwlK
MPKFSKKSQERLETANHLLQLICNLAIKETDFVVICGNRTVQEQQQLYKIGRRGIKGELPVTWIDGVKKKSEHNFSPSKAVDLAPCKVVNGRTIIDWTDIRAFQDLAKIIKRIAAEKNIPIEWGGDWKKRKDMPHFQLNLN